MALMEGEVYEPIDDGHGYSSVGEAPDIDDDFGLTVLNSIASRRRGLRAALKRLNIKDHEVGARVYRVSPGGDKTEVYDGPIANLHLQMSKDKPGAIVRLKDSAGQEFKDHPLRDGLALTVGGMMLLGASIYARSKLRK